jgi:AcrR family transcriptional regulator/DNA-binding MarR family transcriptional regulator
MPPETLNVASVCAAAGVSRSTFYAAFADCDELSLAVFDDIVRRAGEAMDAARAAQASWLDGVRSALIELLDLFDDDPGLARFVVAGSLAGDGELLAHRAHSLSLLVDALDSGSPPAATEPLPAPFGGEAVVGAVASILHSRLLEEPVPPLRPLCGSLMSVIVLSYLGAEAARAELERPLPLQSSSAGVGSTRIGPWPGGSLPVSARTTVRTIQVLAVIGERPEISNREVAVAAAIRDPSQASRLLARLGRLGLVEDRASAGPGRRKAWRLTSAGVDLLAQVGSPLSALAKARQKT